MFLAASVLQGVPGLRAVEVSLKTCLGVLMELGLQDERCRLDVSNIFSNKDTSPC